MTNKLETRLKISVLLPVAYCDAFISKPLGVVELSLKPFAVP